MKMPQPASPNDPAARRCLVLAAIAAVPIAAASRPAAAATSPAIPGQLLGNWRAIDAESETAYAVVESVQTPTGTLSGIVRTLLQGAEQPAPAQTCDKCTPAQAARTRFKTYDATGGFNNVSASLAMLYRYDRHWRQMAVAGIDRLLGDAADSPITETRNQPFAGFYVAYRF